ncbi:hypothetical protein [Halorarum salinum]|uniref:Uncharacterized protein n=1 Tax=Halorarum salinum TaxID=2743089 RepID=A0A7D5QA68_9EURY|nr:hypothetical protein [Halobaculum salinum]QLG62217.1 hypothetical protein HUG12_10935 [Halobaculum salinum]
MEHTFEVFNSDLDIKTGMYIASFDEDVGTTQRVKVDLKGKGDFRGNTVHLGNCIIDATEVVGEVDEDSGDNQQAKEYYLHIDRFHQMELKETEDKLKKKRKRIVKSDAENIYFVNIGDTLFLQSHTDIAGEQMLKSLDIDANRMSLPDSTSEGSVEIDSDSDPFSLDQTGSPNQKNELMNTTEGGELASSEEGIKITVQDNIVIVQGDLAVMTAAKLAFDFVMA